MLNVDLLKRYIVGQGMSVNALAAKCKMPLAAMVEKLNGEARFTTCERYDIMVALHLSRKEAANIFYPHDDEPPA